MSEKSFMITLLILRSYSLERDIDLYLRPLIDELKILWETRVETYDCVSKEKFNMCAALMLISCVWILIWLEFLWL